MYIPPINRMENPEEIRKFITQNDFGILINTNAKQEIFVTHIPFILTQNATGEDVLRGHVAKANPQWKNFATNNIKNNPENNSQNEHKNQVLAVFSGAHSYISPSWYDHYNVPTWNYLAVHVEGLLRIVEEEEMYEHLKELLNHHEQFQDKPMSMEDIPEKILKPDLKGVVGFEILITEIHAKAKLSQNRDEKNKKRIIDALEKTQNPNAHEIAKEMKKSKI